MCCCRESQHTGRPISFEISVLGEEHEHEVSLGLGCVFVVENHLNNVVFLEFWE